MSEEQDCSKYYIVRPLTAKAVAGIVPLFDTYAFHVNFTNGLTGYTWEYSDGVTTFPAIAPYAGPHSSMDAANDSVILYLNDNDLELINIIPA